MIRVRQIQKLILLGLLSGLLGCSGKISVPQAVEQPRQVFVLDHGRHSSLILETAEGTLHRYSYGDWHYYALGQTGLISGARALLIPTQAALGRRILSGPATAEKVEQQVKVSIVNLHRLQAEASEVDALLDTLEAIYQANQSSRIYRQDYDLHFVHHPRKYSLLHNSNQVVGHWLTQLGSEIHGWPVLSDWQIRTSP